MKEFRKDPHYFTKYFSLNLVVFFVLSTIGIYLRDDLFSFDFKEIYYLIFLCAIPTGLVFATAYHNCSHYNTGPKWLNEIIGEFLGAYTLDGIRTFRLGHTLHHLYSDDPILDPHPPAGQTFFHFICHSKNKTIDTIIAYYYKWHKESPKTQSIIKMQLGIFHIGFVFKVVFWFVLLGPELFLFFYIPSFAAYFFGFAHLNYISHLPDKDGEIRIKNHSGNLFFDVMNFFTAGGYYHKNHHLNPKLYNPSKLDSFNEKRRLNRPVRS